MPSEALTNAAGAYAPVVHSAGIVWNFTQGPSLSGSGAPTDDPGVPFASYTNTDDGSQYFWNGTSWTAISGGGGGSGSVLSGDYSGVAPTETPSGPAVARDTVTGQVWWYNSTDGWTV